MARVKFSSLKYSTIKLVIFSSVLLYGSVDLLLWHGPLWEMFYGNHPDSPDTSEIVAEVYGEPITLAQLNRHEAEQDLMAGRNTPEKARRASMLMSLIRSKLLRIRTRYNIAHLPDCRAEAEQEAARLASRASSEAEFDGWLRAQGYTDRQQFTDKVQVRLQSVAQLEQAIEPHTEVTEEEVRRVYDILRPELKVPAGRTVRHIFLELLHKDAAAVEQQARDLLARLQAGETFADLARKHSEDLRTAPLGGELGTIEDRDNRPLKELPLFGEQAIPAGVPTLVRSAWGWHILQADDITAPREVSYEECKESLRTALISVRREQAANAWFKGAVNEGFTKKRIKTNVK